VRVGDVFRVVGAPGDVERLIEEMGKRSAVDLAQVPGGLKRMDLVVTKPGVLRRTLRDLDLRDRVGVTVAQVTRAGVKLVATASLALKFGDQLTVIGPEQGLKEAEAEVGNSREALDRPHLLPIFLGIIAGVALGSVPLVVPGLKAPLRIGLAGGPMLAAIALSQLGSIGSVVWYMPAQASAMVRDLGLAVFLACVGFQSGGGFVQRAAHGGGGVFAGGGCDYGAAAAADRVHRAEGAQDELRDAERVAGGGDDEHAGADICQ
jgi:putative transport protein